MAPSQGSDATRAELNAWYDALRPMKVDLVGDFAGKELFAIHGEALLLYCLIEARVDFTGVLAPPISSARIPSLCCSLSRVPRSRR